MNIDNYLYEIIDDYKSCDTEKERNNIFKLFCSSIWASDNKRRTLTKVIKYKVRKDLIDSDIGKIFDMWSEVEYTGYKSMTKSTDWVSLIRQKVNNLYTRYFDKEVILKKDYMNLLNTPKKLYFQWIDGVEMDLNELTTVIDDSINEAQKLKEIYQKQKMELSWSEYKKVIEGFLKRCFDNCKLIEDYEKNSKYFGMYDFMNEDNFYIKYFCKSVECEMMKWQKKYYCVRDHKKYKTCKCCGCIIEDTGNKKMYCNKCAIDNKKKSNIISDKKYRNKIRENRK
jgi:hypothetical protein